MLLLGLMLERTWSQPLHEMVVAAGGVETVTRLVVHWVRQQKWRQVCAGAALLSALVRRQRDLTATEAVAGAMDAAVRYANSVALLAPSGSGRSLLQALETLRAGGRRRGGHGRGPSPEAYAKELLLAGILSPVARTLERACAHGVDAAALLLSARQSAEALLPLVQPLQGAVRRAGDERGREEQGGGGAAADGHPGVR
jgi:hypothetical protein